MPAVGRLFKLVFGGSLGANAPRVETWSCSIHIGAGADGAMEIGLMTGALSQFMQRAASNVLFDANLEYFKFNELNPVTGLYLSAAASNTFPVEPLVRGTGGGGPFQVSNCYSWVTAVARGRASKGRIFVPANSSSGSSASTSGGRWINPDTVSMANSGAQLITDINGAVNGSAVVFSQLSQTENEILAVRVGDVPDTQRRRRRSLIEQYDQQPVA